MKPAKCCRSVACSRLSKLSKDSLESSLCAITRHSISNNSYSVAETNGSPSNFFVPNHGRKSITSRLSGMGALGRSSTIHGTKCHTSPSSRLNARDSIHFNSQRFQSSSSNKADYYEILGVSRDSADSDIKKAFYKLAKKWHPDANPSPEAKEKFTEINEAYQVLSNKDKRAKYDKFGHAGPGMQDINMDDFANVNLQDIFSQIFGSAASGGGAFGGFPFGGMGGGQSRVQDVTAPQRGEDLQVDVRLDFMDAVNGVSKEVQFKRYDECKDCGSTGILSGTVPTKCTQCQGTGQMTQKSGFMIMQQTCWVCNGTGQTFDPCTSCHGSGLIGSECKLEVNIPAGVDDGTRVRIANQGHSGRNKGGRGHVWLLTRVKQDDRFERHGSDIHVAVEVPVHKAIIGGLVTVPTLKGEAEVKIKPGTPSEHREIMRGKGITDPSTGRMGHQYLHFNVVIPTSLTDKEKELIEEFGKLQDEKFANENI